MHPLVRDLYKRVIHVGADYPSGIDHVRQVWKKAIRNPQNCPSCYTDPTSQACEEELVHAIARGRHMVKEMIGIIQMKKYRTLKQRYGSDSTLTLEQAMERIEQQQ